MFWRRTRNDDARCSKSEVVLYVVPVGNKPHLLGITILIHPHLDCEVSQMDQFTLVASNVLALFSIFRLQWIRPFSAFDY